jgi:predicted acetyltransferase
MKADYRHARPEDMTALMRAQNLGFGDTTARADIERRIAATLIKPEWRLCAFEDGEPVSQIVVVPVEMNWNGRTIAAAGVTDVFTLPTARRKGYLRELMTRAYAQMRGAGQCVAILEASMAAIYQRFGWAVVYTALWHEFDPRHLRFVDEMPTPGRVRLLDREDARPLIEPLYQRYCATRTLAMRRGDFEWSAAFQMASTSRPPLLVAVYEEEGQPLGYAIYRVGQMDPRGGRHPGDPDEQITVNEWVWLTPAAHRALIQFLAGHDLAGSLRLWGFPLDDPLLYQVQEPRALNALAIDGALARIVDVEQALTGRGYDGAGRLRIGLEDGYAPWNSGVWELTAEEGAASVRRVAAEPELRLTPRVLAILLSGYQPASMLARAGLIQCPEPSALAVADALFRTSHVPLCLDHWM